MLEGKMSSNFSLQDSFEDYNPKAPLSWDRFYEALQKWGMHQKVIDYDELTQVEKSPAFMAL